MAAELPPSTRHQSRSRSPSPSAIPQSGPTSSSVVVDPYANHSANAATLNSPPESSHRKRSRSRSPSYTRRRSPSPSSAYQDRPKSFGENSFNGAPKGPLPGAVSIYGAASGNRAPRDGDDRGAGGQGGGGAGNGGSGYRYPRRDGDDRAGGAGGGGGAKNNGVCYAWPTGTCRYGDNCFFKHLDESGREVRKDGPPQRPMLPKRNPAAYPAGAPSYRAQHFGGGGSGGGMSASSGSSYPPSNLCYEFRNEGRCRYGSRCRYSHDTAAGGGSGAAAAAGAGGAGGAPHSQMAAAAPYGGGRREFYGGDRYNAGPAGMPYPPHGPHFSHRRRSRSPRERRSRSRSPRAHRSRSR